jgi:hypothetical protein
MRKLILILILLLTAQKIFSCTCINENSLKQDIKKADLIFKGKVIKVDVITIYNVYGDSIYARNAYENIENKTKYKSYDDFKEKNYGTKQLEITIESLKPYKGKITSEFIKIRTGLGCGDCGYKFELGKVYLVFANNSQYLKYSKDRLNAKWRNIKNVYETNICMRTKLFSNSKDELKRL